MTLLIPGSRKCELHLAFFQRTNGAFRMAKKVEIRTPEQIKHHYDVEKVLANRLRLASAQERKRLYTLLYDQLFMSVPDHPQLTHKKSRNSTEKSVASSMKILHPFLDKSESFLEVGPGDCVLSFEVSKYVRSVYAIDVSEIITHRKNAPHNFHLIISDGSSIPVPNCSIGIAFSNQLMEHLHPNDAVAQLINIYKSLKIGGTYICITPNKLSGPHDISKYYDEEATGFHLKEYTFSELYHMFRQAGFKSTKPIIGARGFYINNIYLAFLIESFSRLLRKFGLLSILRTPLMRIMLPRGIIASKL